MMELLSFVDDLPAVVTKSPCSEDQNRSESQWIVLLVDDDPEVHAITQLALKYFEYEGRSLKLLTAFSVIEAKRLLAEHTEIALALIDAVLETDCTGLDLVRYISEVLANSDMRIVLRTGQAEMLPDESVIRRYDINDFKNKSELTNIKLNALMYSSLRGFRDICRLNTYRFGLERAVDSLSEAAQTRSIPDFASLVLAQLSNLIRLPQEAFYYNAVSLFAEQHGDLGVRLLAVSGFSAELSADNRIELARDMDQKLHKAFQSKRSIIDGFDYVGYFRTNMGSENILYLGGCGELTALDVKMLNLYCASVAVAYENLLFYKELEESQRELIVMLADGVEMQPTETSGHVKRVAETSAMLAQAYGLSEADVELIRHAAPLHDIGKVRIPNEILNKPGRHTIVEREVMQSHARLGFDMLAKSDNRILERGALIALQHHEKWDGSGYPEGLVGVDIDVFARITALADVFDALGSVRCYKRAWDVDEVIQFVQSQRGTHFEPRLVDLLLDNLSAYLALRTIYPD